MAKWDRAFVESRFREILGDDADDSKEAKKRRRILRAAYELFLAHGYRKTSIDDVARKAEVAKGTVYLYFPSKGALLLGAIALEKKSLMARIQPIFAEDASAAERLRRWIELTLSGPRDMPLSARLMSGDNELTVALEDIGQGEIARRQDEGADFLTQLIEQAAPGRYTAEEKRARADMLMGLGWSAAKFLDLRMRAGRSFEDFVSTLTDTLVRGIVGDPKKRRS